MEVTTPVLVVKSKKLGTALTAASLLAAPFTGGTSLAAGAAARGAMVGVQGARAAIAGRKADQARRGLQAAQKTSQTAQTAASNLPKPKVKVTPNRDFGGQFTGNKTRTADSIADIGAGRATQLPDAPAGFPPQTPSSSMQGVIDRTEGAPKENPFHTWDVDNAKQPDGSYANQRGTFSAQQDVDTAQQSVNTAQSQSDKMNEKLQEAQDAYKESIDTNTPIGVASAAGAYGFNQMEQHKKQNEANQKAEMERIEGLAEDARSKASTGTGGKVAVA